MNAYYSVLHNSVSKFYIYIDSCIQIYVYGMFLVLPGALLQHPFYNSQRLKYNCLTLLVFKILTNYTNYSRALNYGAIGTIIGHEFSHAFDNTGICTNNSLPLPLTYLIRVFPGRQADSDGNIKQWWSTDSLANYENHLKCFESHYNKYILDVMGESLDSNVRMQVCMLTAGNGRVIIVLTVRSMLNEHRMRILRILSV